ncbi:translation initiation factor IF-2-like isoform X2 [Mustela erminea]|uniref:translation initiation factor IF-2-like isoform X2 n=1 Tax=Mustela erminea TaxID=36723 RepID=UPI00138720C9|nr:translation initiation factor IF-2-like isoform X2 [Mustela erminea]
MDPGSFLPAACGPPGRQDPRARPRPHEGSGQGRVSPGVRPPASASPRRRVPAGEQPGPARGGAWEGGGAAPGPPSGAVGVPPPGRAVGGTSWGRVARAGGAGDPRVGRERSSMERQDRGDGPGRCPSPTHARASPGTPGGAWETPCPGWGPHRGRGWGVARPGPGPPSSARFAGDAREPGSRAPCGSRRCARPGGRWSGCRGGPGRRPQPQIPVSETLSFPTFSGLGLLIRVRLSRFLLFSFPKDGPLANIFSRGARVARRAPVDPPF